MEGIQVEISAIRASIRCLGIEERLTIDESYRSYEMVAKMTVVVRGATYALEMIGEERQMQRFDIDPSNASDQARFAKGDGWETVRHDVQKVFDPLGDDYDLFEDVTFIAVTLPDALSEAAQEAASAYAARRLAACGQLATRTGQPRWIM